jgi:hypothetical protein
MANRSRLRVARWRGRIVGGIVAVTLILLWAPQVGRVVAIEDGAPIVGAHVVLGIQYRPLDLSPHGRPLPRCATNVEVVSGWDGWYVAWSPWLAVSRTIGFHELDFLAEGYFDPARLWRLGDEHMRGTLESVQASWQGSPEHARGRLARIADLHLDEGLLALHSSNAWCEGGDSKSFRAYRAALEQRWLCTSLDSRMPSAYALNLVVSSWPNAPKQLTAAIDALRPERVPPGDALNPLPGAMRQVICSMLDIAPQA